MFDFDKTVRDATCDVLVLDNEAIIRSVTAEMLEDIGFLVCEAADSAEALARMTQVPCSILLVDVMLGPDSPIQDGRIVAAEAMRRDPDQAVIYSSGSPVELGRPLTARERVLLKPYRPKQLVLAIRELLMARSGGVRVR